MRVLVTGLTGFAGSHLVDDLLAHTDWEVWGTAFGPPTASGWNDPRVHVLDADLLDSQDLVRVMAVAQPELVFHLAGQSSVRDAWTHPWPTFETNVRMQLGLLQALHDRGNGVRMVTITSNEIYGAGAGEGSALDESAPFAPVNPYALSKVAQDLLAELYGRAYGLDVVRLRPFTHIGPRQSDAFVTGSFARQVAEIEAGRRPPVMLVGNLDAQRDLSDVRDIVQGYRLAALRGRTCAAYNLGSGVARSIRSVLDWFVSHAGVQVEVRPDPDRQRPADVPCTRCDASRARAELEWAPRIPFEQTLSDILGYWRAQVAADQGS